MTAREGGGHMERIKMMSVVDVKQERMTGQRKRPPGALNGKLESGRKTLKDTSCVTARA